MAVDSSSQSGSASILEDGDLLGEVFLQNGFTHSQTLMPMVERLFAICSLTPDDIDLYAVTCGPGSFTGLRIGVAAVKGLCIAGGQQCVPLSTLEALSYNFLGIDGIVCPVLDARRRHMYSALFSSRDGTIERLTPDQILSVEELSQQLRSYEGVVYLVGDGAELCYNGWDKQTLSGIRLAPAHLRHTRASSAALLAWQMQDGAMDAADIALNYIQRPQAQRELEERLGRPFMTEEDHI